MTVWVRNLRVPDVTTQGGSALLIAIRELLRVDRWTEQSNDGDPDWPDPGSPNWVVGPTDLSVDPLSPRVITSSSSPFTSAMVGDMIALLATNDQNRSMWRITGFIDANNIEVDAQGFNPFNWTLESGITGRVVKVASPLTAATAQALWNAPGGSNLQARIFYSAADASICYARPKGQVPLANETSGITFTDSTDYKHVMHMIASDENVLIYWSTEDNNLKIVMWGKLLDADAADTDPNFILGSNSPTSDPLWGYTMRMLDGADTDIATYPTFVKKNLSSNTGGAFFNYFNSRLANDRSALLRSPWVCLADVATVGACVRGRIPILAQTYQDYERLRPLDAAGAWLHTYQGVAVPRNGPDDPLPMIPA